ncbi:hypothetical protein BLS_001757 [Venturia inaequalis]|uniref:Uncharacterized protein n=1 Tax=Venturia inaequalis TaxID=5025 RepID=A0A8H3YL14_VENIN|nr:hypothetical protein BLS_001757 [Venturia inaequalis]RDI81532.1 hypothetical protein Vi05172_g8472 [Venturia inaequalis]
MTRKNMTSADKTANEQLGARVDTVAEELVGTRAANDKLHDTVSVLSKRLDDSRGEKDGLHATVDILSEKLDDQARAGKAEKDELHATVDVLSKKLDDQARAGKAEKDKLQATVDKLVLITESLSQTAMANSDKNEQLQLVIKKMDEQHDNTRQRLGKIPLHIREDFEHLFKVVHSLRLHDDRLEAGIKDMREKLTAHSADGESSAELDTLKHDYEVLHQKLSGLVVGNDKFRAEVATMKLLQVETDQKVDELAARTESLSEASTISEEKTRERIGTLRSDQRDDYKDMLRMITDVVRENKNLQYKVDMAEEKLVHESRQLIKHEAQIASLEKGGEERDRTCDLLAEDVAVQSQIREKGHEELCERVKKQGEIIVTIGKHLDSLYHVSGDLKEQFDGFVKGRGVLENNLKDLSEKMDQMTSDFKEEKNAVSKKLSGLTKNRVKLQQHVDSAEVGYDELSTRVTKLANQVDAQLTAQDNEVLHEKILKLTNTVTKNQKTLKKLTDKV